MIVRTTPNYIADYTVYFNSTAAAEDFYKELLAREDCFLVSQLSTQVNFSMRSKNEGRTLAKNFEAGWIEKLAAEKQARIAAQRESEAN